MVEVLSANLAGEESEEMKKLWTKIFSVGVKLTKLVAQLHSCQDKNFNCSKESKTKLKADLAEAQKDNVLLLCLLLLCFLTLLCFVLLCLALLCFALLALPCLTLPCLALPCR